ncbi:MAG: hypothetical protein WC562_04360 [Dehalococcoidia bacterium]|jgi:hypothetical protein
MASETLKGILIGIRDGVNGPVLVINIRGQEKKLDLKCQVSIDFAFKRMNTPVTCQVEDGNVVKVS